MDDLAFGLQVTILGMGIVFGLLALLWLLLTLVLRLESRADARAQAGADSRAEAQQRATLEGSPGVPAEEAGVVPEAGSAPASPVLPGSVRLVGAPADMEPALVAAIGVVILRHTETRRRQAAPAMRSYWPGSLLFASRWVASGRTRQARSWTRRAR
jgi:Na+-transporting methylmalonyl-CoA/oxaloacetate decarboxylase gamma subunit